MPSSHFDNVSDRFGPILISVFGKSVTKKHEVKRRSEIPVSAILNRVQAIVLLPVERCVLWRFLPKHRLVCRQDDFGNVAHWLSRFNQGEFEVEASFGCFSCGDEAKGHDARTGTASYVEHL